MSILGANGTDRIDPKLPGDQLGLVDLDNGEIVIYDPENTTAWIQGRAFDLGTGEW